MRVLKLLIYTCLIGVALVFVPKLLRPKKYHTIPWRTYEREDS